MAGDIDLSEMRFAMGEATKWSIYCKHKDALAAVESNNFGSSGFFASGTQLKDSVLPIQSRSRLSKLPQADTKPVRQLTGGTMKRTLELLATQPAHIRGVIKLDTMMKLKRMRSQGDCQFFSVLMVFLWMFQILVLLLLKASTLVSMICDLTRPTQFYNKTGSTEATTSSNKWSQGGDKSEIWLVK